MKEVIQFLSENPVQNMATIGLDNKPKVRPFQFMLEDGGKLYFCTNNQKEVYAEVKKQPCVELSSSTPAFAWIRLNGNVVFSSDMAIKEKIVANNPLIKQLYETATNPIFEIFYLSDAKAVIADFSGNPPQEYTL